MASWLLIIALSMLVVLVVAWRAFHPERALHVASGLVSHTLGSGLFVSGLNPEQIYAEAIRPRQGMGLLTWALRYQVDPVQREVATTIFGRFPSRALYRDGLGCLLVNGVEPADPPPKPYSAPPALFEIAGPAVVTPGEPGLRAALDAGFAEPQHPPYRWTKAVVVLLHGQVVAERYAPGYGIDTPVLGWSDTKSVINALIGILVRDGKLSLHQPAPVPAWPEGDPRHAITINHLLRMTSGLALKETHSGLDPLTQMLYREHDMASFAEAAPLEAEPGTLWSYTGGNTLILSRIIRDAVGGHAEDVLRFARRELFEPLGMRNVTLEFDATGTPIGSTYMYAPAREWARFGLLYLNDGIASGRRILPEGWVEYTATPTLDGGYGAGFWTNLVDGIMPGEDAPWGLEGAPRDTFFARGFMGQIVAIVPSRDLVVARFGISNAPGADIDGVARLVTDVAAAVDSASLTTLL